MVPIFLNFNCNCSFRYDIMLLHQLNIISYNTIFINTYNNNLFRVEINLQRDKTQINCLSVALVIVLLVSNTGESCFTCYL